MMTTKTRTPSAVLLFRRRFVAPIQAETKRQTVRGPRKRPILPGATLHLRAWTGKPYRSPQFVIRPPVVCTSVEPVWVLVDGPILQICLSGRVLGTDQVDAFARADGFAGRKAMNRYYRAQGVAEFQGHVYRWEPTG